MQERVSDRSAENLLRLRKAGHLSRREVLDLLSDYGIDMHETTLRRIEEGIQPLKVIEALAFSRVFGVTLEELVDPDVDPLGAEVRAKLSTLKNDHQIVRRKEHDWLTGCHNLGESLDLSQEPATRSPAVREARDYLDATREEREARQNLGPFDVPR